MGHHWAYRREQGEPQLVFNYVRAFSNYINNFTFGKGIEFHSDERVAHIVPALIDRILTVDNHKEQLLWGMGNMGSVSGDVFVKVAYDPPWFNAIGEPKPGRVRLLNLNPAFCFPEWAPHDMERLLRFKLKYRFWATAAEGTRQVYTYTEIITDDVIEEYINDQLIRQNPNPLGEIPIVHIANMPAASSPWGLSDIVDVLSLNRQYNETFTDVVDIINYHTAPVTVVTGAKASNLEQGPNKLWGILQKDAKVYNLEGGTEGLDTAIEALNLLKANMHEMVGIPVTALGQEQSISNTSGVALAIQFFPLMMMYSVKTMQYAQGWKMLIYFALKTLFLKEPETMLFNPDTAGMIVDEAVQKPVVDPLDPVTYDVDVAFPPPLPVDMVIKLNEIMMKMQLGLESKKGALIDLGEEFPDEKLQELFEEQIRDAKYEGAKRLVTTGIDSAIMNATGMIPAPSGGDEASQPAPGPDQEKNADGSTSQVSAPPPPAIAGLGDLSKLTNAAAGDTFNELVTMAYGTKIPQARNIDKNSSTGAL